MILFTRTLRERGREGERGRDRERGRGREREGERENGGREREENTCSICVSTLLL